MKVETKEGSKHSIRIKLTNEEAQKLKAFLVEFDHDDEEIEAVSCDLFWALDEELRF
jgi:predicted DNA-binding antitoxin AbrB/MazE fold protein